MHNIERGWTHGKIHHINRKEQDMDDETAGEVTVRVLQQKVYRADLNYLRGAAWIATGALAIEGSKKASELISDVGP